MAYEPSNAELGRRLDEILHTIQKLISREEFTGEQKLTEHRFTEIEADIRDLRARMDKREESTGASVRQAVYAGLIPTALLLVSILLQLKGGR